MKPVTEAMQTQVEVLSSIRDRLIDSRAPFELILEMSDAIGRLKALAAIAAPLPEPDYDPVATRERDELRHEALAE
jgi:hypothetical protein